jgi:rubrerythrin
MKTKNMDFAVQMEKDGCEFYTQAANTIKDKAAQSMLLSLAKDEQKHEQIIRDMQAGNPAVLHANDFSEVKNVFKLLSGSSASFFHETDNLTRVLKKAVQIEKKSVDLYDYLADQTLDPASGEIFTRLAHEEKMHRQILETVLENIDTPHIILENAEFLFYDHEESP